MKRDMTNNVLLGVCSGLAKEFKVDAVLIRLAFVVATLAGLGMPILIYLILAILMPKE